MSLERKYHLLTHNNLRSQKFVITNTDNLYETAQLLRDIQFSVLGQEIDSIPLRLFDNKNEIISFDYLVSKNKSEQIFKNDLVEFTIDFNYRTISKNTYILCCPSFTIIKHPSSWSKNNHYGQCGQSCPCCRAHVGDTLGACPICK